MKKKIMIALIVILSLGLIAGLVYAFTSQKDKSLIDPSQDPKGYLNQALMNRILQPSVKTEFYLNPSIDPAILKEMEKDQQYHQFFQSVDAMLKKTKIQAYASLFDVHKKSSDYQFQIAMDCIYDEQPMMQWKFGLNHDTLWFANEVQDKQSLKLNIQEMYDGLTLDKYVEVMFSDVWEGQFTETLHKESANDAVVYVGKDEVKDYGTCDVFKVTFQPNFQEMGDSENENVKNKVEELFDLLISSEDYKKFNLTKEQVIEIKEELEQSGKERFDELTSGKLSEDVAKESSLLCYVDSDHRLVELSVEENANGIIIAVGLKFSEGNKIDLDKVVGTAHSVLDFEEQNESGLIGEGYRSLFGDFVTLLVGSTDETFDPWGYLKDIYQKVYPE